MTASPIDWWQWVPCPGYGTDVPPGIALGRARTACPFL